MGTVLYWIQEEVWSVISFCGQKGQLQLKFIMKFKQFIAQIWWPCSICESGVGNLVAVAWVWQMNKGAGVTPHQRILSLQLRRLYVLIAKCCLKSWKNSLIFHMAHIWGIVHERLGYRKLCSRWVPQQLTEDHKKIHMGASLTHLLHFNDHGEDFLGQINNVH